MPRVSNEVAALDKHLALLNSIPQIGAPDGVAPPAGALAFPPVPSAAPPPAMGGVVFAPPAGVIGSDGAIGPAGTPALEEPQFITDTPPVAPPPTRTAVQKLFFTGRLKSGKDFAAKASGATIFGFADPLYAIATHFFGINVSPTEGKDIPGMRAFLQAAGQWGRNAVSEQYPLTAGRALFIAAVRAAGVAGELSWADTVEWDTYGKNPDIWLNACILRANAFLAENPGARVAITNCRFGNEYSRLQAEGFEHWHCMAGPKTWAARLAESKLTPESPSVRDTSEQLAVKLDQNVIKQLSEKKVGPNLKCIWSDPSAAVPSRLHSVASFLQTIGGAQ